MLLVSKKRATTNNNNNTKCTRNSVNCRFLSSLCTGRFSKCSSPSGKDHYYISECKQRIYRRLSPRITKLKHKSNCRVRRTDAIPTTLNQLRAKILHEWNNLPQNYVQRHETSMRRRCLVVANSAGTCSLLSLHGHGRRCRIWLKSIVIFTLSCDIFDQAWSLLKYWKNVNFDFTINLNFAFAFFNFLFYSK